MFPSSYIFPPLLSLPSLILNLQRHNHLNVVNADVYIPAGNMLLLLNSFYSYKYTRSIIYSEYYILNVAVYIFISKLFFFVCVYLYSNL